MAEYWATVEAALVTFATGYGLQIAGAIVIALVGWAIAGWASRAAGKYGAKRLSKTLVPLFSRLVRWSILAIVLVAVLDKFGVETTSLLAFIGAAGLAIGLALKDTISDVASGVVLLVLRPFDVGDAVDIAGTGGVIDAIDLFETKLTTFDGVPVVLPNSSVRSAKISNYARARQRRIDLSIGIGYSADIGKALSAITDVLTAEARVLTDPEPIVNVDTLGDSSVNLLVRVHCAAADFLALKMDLTRAIKERLDQAGVQNPFPQRDVHIINENAA